MRDFNVVEYSVDPLSIWYDQHKKLYKVEKLTKRVRPVYRQEGMGRVFEGWETVIEPVVTLGSYVSREAAEKVGSSV